MESLKKYCSYAILLLLMELESYDFNQIALPLQDWFCQNARILPWRQDPTPYHVWVSEIMLQQTRVEAVISYYRRFMRVLPNVQTLAEAEESVTLKLWEGLGYYSRVRNLQKAAQKLMEVYNGKLPDNVVELLSLPGIGSYTAGAIASLAYGKRVPAVDGNVLRVLMRITGDASDIAEEKTKKRLQQYLQQFYDASGPEVEPKKLNQAMMELGALVCIPNGRPDCEGCPVKRCCLAHLQDLTEALPVKKAKKERRIEHRTVFVITLGDQILLHRRPAKGLLAGLYELPNTEGELTEEEARAYAQSLGLMPLKISETKAARHIFTHIEWQMKGYEISVMTGASEKKLKRPFSEKDLAFFSPADLMERIALPSAFAGFRPYLPGAALPVQNDQGR